MSAEILTLTSTSTPTIDSLTAAGAGAGTFAAGGAVGINNITNTTEVFITDGATVVVNGSLTMTALDSPTIEAGAGAIDAAGAVALSAGIATNNIGDDVTAYVDGASTITALTMAGNATENGSIEAASMGVSAAADVAVSGAVNINQIANTTDVHVSGGAVITTNGNMSFIAQDTSTDTTQNAQVAAAIAGIGGAVSYNVIGNHVRSYANGAKLNATGAGVYRTGNVIFQALSTATINCIVAGISGGVVGIAGTVAVTLLQTDVTAYIAASVVDAFANVVVDAESTDQLQVIAGAVAVGLVGAGGTVVVNTMNNTTQADIEDSTVVAQGQGAFIGVDSWNATYGCADHSGHLRRGGDC